MSDLVPTPASIESVQKLLELATREGEEEALLHRLVEVYRSSSDLGGAALYLPEEDGDYRLRLAVGTASFPQAIQQEDEAAQQGLRLPGALLRHEPAAASPEPAPELVVALAVAIRALRLCERLKRQRFEVNYRGVELEALYDVGLAIASTLNLEELSEEILLRAVSLLDARRGALYLVSDDEYRLDRTFGGDARGRVALDDPQLDGTEEGEAEPVDDLLPGASHLLALPIEADGRAKGVLVMGDKESRTGVGPFQDSDRRTLSLFANQAAIALENARLHRQALEKERLERELELAADIQRRLLPTALPQVEGFELTGWSRAARHVGGDFYDLMELPAGKLSAVVADVSGKGMPAALLVSTLHSALRLLTDRVEIGSELVSLLNQHILGSSTPNKFITLMLAELDPEQCVLKYVNAGHNPAILLRAGGEVRELSQGGMPLGIFAGGDYQTASVGIDPGDLLCFYSDGITEAEDPEDDQFGPDRLIDLLRSEADRPLEEIVSSIEQATTRFASGRSQADDQTLVLLRRNHA